MLYTTGLEEIIFNRHEIIPSDELLILSGYVGPAPVRRLQKLPIRATVVYGMYGGDGISQALHNSLIDAQNTGPNVRILYSHSAVHAKCYAWRNNGEITHALVGSANFSTNGLTTPQREILAETTRDTFAPLNHYIGTILSNSVPCTTLQKDSLKHPKFPKTTTTAAHCHLSLLDIHGEVPMASGLNWGHAPRGNTNPNDAYIGIKTRHIKQFPDLFPPKQTAPTDARNKRKRHNDYIEIVWDDGATMEGLLLGNQTIDGITYPKQISSSHAKEMGQYLRKRLGIPQAQLVTKHHLKHYGRTTITAAKIGEGIYYLDFSPQPAAHLLK